MLTGLELALPQCYISRSSILLTGYAVGVGSAKNPVNICITNPVNSIRVNPVKYIRGHKKNTLPIW